MIYYFLNTLMIHMEGYQTMKRKMILLAALSLPLLFTSGCATGSGGVPAAPETASEEQPRASKPLIYLYATEKGLADNPTQTEEEAVKAIEKILRTEPVFRNLAEIRFRRPLPLDGKNLTAGECLKLARKIQAVLDKPEVSGIVITHNSNTLEDTAYFLNLLIRSEKPIVLVQTIPPVKTVTMESMLNFYNALAAAASPESRGMGVLVSMNDTIYAARDAEKDSGDGSNSNRSGDFGPLGFIINGKPQYYYRTTRRHTARTEFDLASIQELPKVQTVYLYADDSPLQILDWTKKGVRGIVVDCSGEGVLKPAIQNALKQAMKAGVVVVLASRTGSAAEIPDGEIAKNAVLENSLTPQKSAILLMLALTRTSDPHLIQEYFKRY